ncbi:MAG: MarR family transcriptional regulator [Candidatus Dormiibacterota bacterium]
MSEDAIDRIVAEWNRARPDLDVSPTHVLQRITRLYLLQSNSFASVFSPFGLTFGEYEVLAALLRSGPPHRMKPKELVGALVLSSGAVTNRIDRVEAAGLVERLPDPDDRRGTLVALTGEGRRVLDRAARAHLDNEERLLAGLSPRRRRELADLLRRLLLSPAFAELEPQRSGQLTAGLRRHGGQRRR